jgi:APA family basic amino acid/polyamine antiporter
VLIMLAWALGGLIAIIGAGVFAELAARRPRDGGVYAYLRDAFHPAVAFCYGWTLLLVSQSGGAAAAAVTFATYFEPLTGLHVPASLIAVVIIAFFTIVNCLGVRQGASTQNVFMLLKIAAIAGVIGVGIAAVAGGHGAAHVYAAPLPPFNPIVAIGFALVPVLFTYSGWQTSSFMTGEIHQPQRTLPFGMLFGVLGVIVLYLAMNAVCLVTLGPVALAATSTPASDVVQALLGPVGARVMAAVIALSTLGFISNQILTSPRVYYQMAADGNFFKALGRINSRTHVPTAAIAVQGIAAILIALSNRYDLILNWVTSVDYVFFGLSAIALIIFRGRDRSTDAPQPAFSMPGHPWSTITFLIVAWSIVLDVLIKSPKDTFLGIALLITGVPVWYLFHRRAERSVN